MTGCINTSRPVPDSVFDNCRLSAEQHGLEHEVLTPEQVSARFPGYRLPPGFKVRSVPPPRGSTASERCACLSSCHGRHNGEPRMPAAPGYRSRACHVCCMQCIVCCSPARGSQSAAPGAAPARGVQGLPASVSSL